MWDVEFLYIGI